ncbi:MAG: B12-binding domain-containing radical SAM protein [Nanoarchaeota archaeon]|nr:B12-binding domain-containing radical SAM protein [Nanoarchaeota archaeon]MBU1051177.1 B12-binding domain-containing radical SAM protein [Nanoarchaeota archaeon]MBU1988266.1 B12-binding domain-containing radical SAM protein [Nanoarchaeota archaeon]
MDVLFVVEDVRHHSPIGMMQVSAIAKQRGDQTHLGVLSREDVLNKIDKLKPNVVAYGGSTGEHKFYERFNSKLKQRHPEIFTVMGGTHATFFPEIMKDAKLDAVVVGEGEQAFKELLDRVERGEDVSGLQNVRTHSQPETTLRPLIQDLDSLPFPDRSLFFENTENGQAPIKHFMASRGCPYKCSYCFNSPFKGMYPGEKYVRRHSVGYVLEEILDTLSDYPAEFIKFYDDVLTFRVDDWLREFAQRYKQEVGLSFYCLTRADLMTEEMAKLLKEAGCQTVQMAAESTNDRIRNELLHRNMTKEQMKKAFKICADKGMTVVTNYILGLPGSTVQDDIDAVYFNIEAGVPVPEFPIFQPYPGTELGDLCVREGWFDGDFDSIHTSYNNRSPLNCFNEEEKDIHANINRLGQIATTCARDHPSITNLIMNHLIHQRGENEAFARAYTEHKWELYNRLVYPFKHSEETKQEMLGKSLRLGVSDRTDEVKPIPQADSTT